MSQRIYRSISEKIRKDPAFDERWRGPDKGLITCWEDGRRLRLKEPELAQRAENGELPVLGWKGGVGKKIKKGEKYGTLNYLAQLQGILDKDLDIDPSEDIPLRCSRTGMKVICTGDMKKYMNSGENNSFIALDVETANADMASICQIGIVKYENGNVVDEWNSLIDPEDYFDGFNVAIHGINDNDVDGSPKVPDIHNILEKYLNGNICVIHTSFDRLAINRAINKYGLTQINTTWLDSSRIARRTWEECAWSGYGLANVCKIIGYNFEHHNALEDAKAAAQVTLAAIEKTGLDIESWLERVNNPIDPTSLPSSKIKKDGNPEGDLYGEVIVFTGQLEIPRREAADIAADAGCAVAPNVTKKTTMLVVGDQDISKLGGKEKSNKHIKVEQLISKGQAIRIMKESDFKMLVSDY
jgi:DNA polymerase-3 subunit epsilon